MGLVANSGATVTYKTLQDTVAELQHSGKLLLLILDCESCEWDIYRDILSLDEPIQQVLMQMHGTPSMANELFSAMKQAGYVIFHREPTNDGEVYDYSWLKLSPSFFDRKAKREVQVHMSRNKLKSSEQPDASSSQQKHSP